MHAPLARRPTPPRSALHIPPHAPHPAPRARAPLAMGPAAAQHADDDAPAQTLLRADLRAAAGSQAIGARGHG